MPTASVNGIDLYYYRRLGPGPKVVLLHGLGGSSAFWYFKIVPLLDEHYDLMLYDMRGHGRSSMPAHGYTTADMAGDLHALVTSLGAETVHLVGHSYGGATALHYTVLHPERVESLTIADSRIRSLQPTQTVTAWPSAELVSGIFNRSEAESPSDSVDSGPALLEALAEARVQGRSMRMVGIDGVSPFAWRKGAQTWIKLLHTTTARRDITSVSGLTPEAIGTVLCPVLAVFGELSSCLPSCHGLTRCLPNCSTSVIPRAGHFYPITRAAEFAGIVNKFVAQSDGRQRRLVS
jgi:pimeloyl-ACP methyl ester carboxylesterase